MVTPPKSMRTTILPFALLGLIVGVAGCSPEVSTDDTISPSCPGSDLHVTPADLAKTPRPDAVAEGLAIEASGALFAPDDVYERIHRDLANIGASHPEIADIGYIPSISGDGLIVMFDDTGIAAIKAKTYKDWDCLNTLLGLNVQKIFALIPAAVLRSNELYNLQVLAKK